MSRYFFDLHNGDGPVLDDEGQELATRESVAMEVGRILGDIARDEMPETRNGTIALTVRDDTGRTITVARLTFSNEWID
ncbi:hypothetical protein C8J36_103592 [Rhizobium sp. PP-F2F-G48]|uniref:DUF6894 family protein n=1 Tax=Rhizobium sp. PP-F2F-G48 TaxID=2135651 RepID=UPI00104CCBAD|nr:hypothetical protein [Rhizobium sp. PP-F2F-G48]TCM56217.1 hypothetical protein C8J36_103592 [Rhizobium sp. PP-F2F-G48]